jgi:hypothetical protein
MEVSQDLDIETKVMAAVITIELALERTEAGMDLTPAHANYWKSRLKGTKPEQ